MKAETFSNIWQNSFRMHYEDLIEKTDTLIRGNKILFEDTAGNMNVSPSISPNGEYVAFFSERMFLPSTCSLQEPVMAKLRSLTSSARDIPISTVIIFWNRMGTWSPDSRYFAYVAVAKGESRI
jgi:Tol biopolymer transport system component